jgi:hypothetical protein
MNQQRRRVEFQQKAGQSPAHRLRVARSRYPQAVMAWMACQICGTRAQGQRNHSLFLGGMSRRRDSFAMKGDEEKARAAG